MHFNTSVIAATVTSEANPIVARIYTVLTIAPDWWFPWTCPSPTFPVPTFPIFA